MTQPNEFGAGSSPELLRQMTAASPNSVNKVIRFANNDVPEYLEKLRRFEEESRKVEIFVK